MYVISVKTGNLPLTNGADAHITCEMIGELGSMRKTVTLHESFNHHRKFQPGQIDYFIVPANEKADSVCTIVSIELTRKGNGCGSNWHCQYVEVFDVEAGLSYEFAVNRRIPPTRNGQNTVVRVSCGKVSVKPPPPLPLLGVPQASTVPFEDMFLGHGGGPSMQHGYGYPPPAYGIPQQPFTFGYPSQLPPPASLPLQAFDYRFEYQPQSDGFEHQQQSADGSGFLNQQTCTAPLTDDLQAKE